MSQIIADRYARALFELAIDHDLVDRVDQDLALLTQTNAENSDLRLLLEHPLVARDDQKAVILKIYGPHLDPLTLKFLQLLFDKGRGRLLELVKARFHHLASRLAKRLIIQLTTAVPIPMTDLRRLTERLERQWDRRLEIEHLIDSHVVGGVRMRVEDQVVDGSLRGALDHLRQELLNSA